MARGLSPINSSAGRLWYNQSWGETLTERLWPGEKHADYHHANDLGDPLDHYSMRIGVDCPSMVRMQFCLKVSRR